MAAWLGWEALLHGRCLVLVGGRPVVTPWQVPAAAPLLGGPTTIMALQRVAPRAWRALPPPSPAGCRDLLTRTWRTLYQSDEHRGHQPVISGVAAQARAAVAAAAAGHGTNFGAGTLGGWARLVMLPQGACGEAAARELWGAAVVAAAGSGGGGRGGSGHSSGSGGAAPASSEAAAVVAAALAARDRDGSSEGGSEGSWGSGCSGSTPGGGGGGGGSSAAAAAAAVAAAGAPPDAFMYALPATAWVWASGPPTVPAALARQAVQQAARQAAARAGYVAASMLHAAVPAAEA